MLTPVALSIITNTFTDPKSRAKAIGLWGGVSGISMAAGPLLGGLLTQNIGWRSIFWINVPIGILALALTARFIPDSKAARVRRFDPVGQVLMATVLATVISLLNEGPHLGWRSFFVVCATLLFIAAFAALIFYERMRVEPLIDLRFFPSVQFSSATLMAILVFTAFSGLLFLNSLYLEEVRGFSPMQTGLCMLPMGAMMIFASPIAGKLVASGHARIAIVTAGFALTACALILIALGSSGDLKGLLFAYALFGLGFGLINVPITNAAVSSLPNSRAGLAAAFTATSRQVGASLGVAVAGSIVGAQVSSSNVAATAPFWWFIVFVGLAVVLLGLVSSSVKARRRDLTVAQLLDEQPQAQRI
jgi:EmrB/QacA subfamily drug resistance transporter